MRVEGAKGISIGARIDMISQVNHINAFTSKTPYELFRANFLLKN
jgi:hypothetical protein